MIPRQHSERVRLGVIGCGPTTFNAHADAISRASNVQLQAIADPDPVRLADMSERLRPARNYKSADDLLGDPQVDLVFIAGDDAHHLPMARKTLAAGKHVLLGNSFRVPVEDGEQLRHLAAGRTFALGCHRRFLPGVRATQRFLADEGGQVVSFASYYFDNSAHPITACSTKLRATDRRLCSWLAHGPELLDMARHLLGPISAIRVTRAEVHATQSAINGATASGGGYVLGVDLRFSSGFCGQCSLVLQRGGSFEEGFELRCAGGRVTCKYPYYWFQREHTRIYSAARKLFWSPDARDCHTVRLELEALAHTILTGAPQVNADLEDGIACTEALAAGSFSSLHGGQWVDLETVTGDVTNPFLRGRELAVA